MGFKINAFTGEVQIDYSQLKELVKDSFNVAKSLSNKFSDTRERKQIEEFLACREFLASDRKLAAILAELYYRGLGLKTLDEKIPILYKDEWIPPIPIALRKVRLDWRSYKEFNFDRSIFAKEEILPFGEKRYSSLQLQFIEGITLYDNPTYRLIKIENPKEDDYTLRFTLDTYFNYINTCELLAYEFCKEVMKTVKEDVEFSANSVRDRTKLRLRSRIDPFDFTNRSTATGINTILIVLDSEHSSKFYLHERSTKLAEAMNMVSVVPAGTFQPRHKYDAYHSQDFDLYTNLVREFAEELLGEKEFRNLSTELTDIFQMETLKKINFFVKKGLIKVYYLGIGLDCLTTKPEILTALVLEREIVDTFLWREFMDCFEGKCFQVEFSSEQVRRFVEHDKIAPAGAACLLLVEKNFEFLRSIHKATT